ncbi:MAG: hypothetical protein M3280_00070 [Actinomycetota bacterium]|nr:hypothetical protein [Actinomycetota bacterium]
MGRRSMPRVPISKITRAQTQMVNLVATPPCPEAATPPYKLEMGAPSPIRLQLRQVLLPRTQLQRQVPSERKAARGKAIDIRPFVLEASLNEGR